MDGRRALATSMSAVYRMRARASGLMFPGEHSCEEGGAPELARLRPPGDMPAIVRRAPAASPCSRTRPPLGATAGATRSEPAVPGHGAECSPGNMRAASCAPLGVRAGPACPGLIGSAIALPPHPDDSANGGLFPGEHPRRDGVGGTGTLGDSEVS